LKSECYDSPDCVEGHCAYSEGLGRGECTDGELMSFCVTADDCTSMHCYTGGNSAGTCTSGASGQPCYRAEDCESGKCNAYQCQ
jgi:hypothetical protein